MGVGINHPMNSSGETATLPSCTVVLCTRQRPSQLRQCLESLRRLNYPRFRVLVIENDAVPGEAEELAQTYGAAYRLCTQRGLSAARNLGARLCSTDLLAFMDDDAICDPDWLSRAAPRFQDPKVYAVTGKIVFHSDAECTASPAHEFDPGDRLVDRQTSDWFGMTIFGGVGLGSNFVVRKVALEAVGGFDERLGRGTLLHASEENLFLFQLVNAGHRVATCSEALVRHPVHGDGRPDSPMRSIAASTAMVALLALEHPGYLPKLVHYLWGAARREPQPWRNRSRQLFQGVASRWRVYLALAGGPLVYIFAALRHLIEGTPQFTSPTGVGRIDGEILSKPTERAVPRLRA
jgi:cellulose synthase/poly-beta-1,6-N-acetylglucosamine synthase-like glycosyltransferase